jgi:hypothetical protein
MKKISHLPKKKIIYLVIGINVVIMILSGIFLLIKVNSPYEKNKQIISRQLDNDSLLQNKIGFISTNNVNILLEKIEGKDFDYYKKEVDGSDGKRAIIEYWVDKRNTVWKLDSTNVIKVWYKY